MNARRSLLPAALLSVAALTAGTLLPVAASAQGGSGVSAITASRSEERAGREQERAARVEERRVAREERAAARRSQRAERAARRSARAGSGGGGSVDSEAHAPESGANAPLPESGAAQAGDLNGRCTVSIDASSHLITAGETVTIFGKVSCPPGTSASNQRVAISQSQNGAATSAFSVLGTATTEADGSYKLAPTAPQANAIFRIRAGNRRAHTSVKVAPDVTLSISEPAAQTSAAVHGHQRAAPPGKATFSGAVNPLQAGAVVALQIEHPAIGDGWHTVAFGDVGADGKYSITHGFRTPGQLTVRTVVHPHGLNVPGASEPIAYEVAQQQNPQLTIASSTDPASYGQSTNITGVADGVANGPVTLLARTQAGAYVGVAKTTTDGGGSYTFTEIPLQNTSYKVTDAGTSSTTLFEGVQQVLKMGATPGTVEAGAQTAFPGSLSPAHAGETVYLERQYSSGIGFHVVASATVDSTGTSFSLLHVFANVGTYVMRVKVPADAQNQASASAPFTVQVTAAPAAALSPEAPAPEV